MTMTWHSDSANNNDGADFNEHFQCHDERMRRFRDSHPVETSWAAAAEKEVCFNLWPLRKVAPGRFSAN